MNSIEINNLAFTMRYAIKYKEIDKLKLCSITLTKDNFLEVNRVYQNIVERIDATRNHIIHDIVIMFSRKTDCNNMNEDNDYYSALLALLSYVVNLDVEVDLNVRSGLGYTALEHAFFCDEEYKERIIEILLGAGAAADPSKYFEVSVQNSENEKLIDLFNAYFNAKRINKSSYHLRPNIPLMILGLSILIFSSAFLVYFSNYEKDFSGYKQWFKIFMIAGVTGCLTGIFIVGSIVTDVLKNSCKSSIDAPFLLSATNNEVIHVNNLRDRSNVMESML